LGVVVDVWPDLRDKASVVTEGAVVGTAAGQASEGHGVAVTAPRRSGRDDASVRIQRKILKIVAARVYEADCRLAVPAEATVGSPVGSERERHARHAGFAVGVVGPSLAGDDDPSVSSDANRLDVTDVESKPRERGVGRAVWRQTNKQTAQRPAAFAATAERAGNENPALGINCEIGWVDTVGVQCFAGQSQDALSAKEESGPPSGR
jgi:hypothetical protein